MLNDEVNGEFIGDNIKFNDVNMIKTDDELENQIIMMKITFV